MTISINNNKISSLGKSFDKEYIMTFSREREEEEEENKNRPTRSQLEPGWISKRVY
jgi:hypothetical protein